MPKTSGKENDEGSRARAVAVLAPRAGRFALRVLREFLGNRGILLAGGVGYNVLLSVVPLFAVLGVALTFVVDEERLFTVLNIQARQLAPGHADLLLEAVGAFLASRDVIGVVGFAVLLFFSSFAFRMLEDAIGIIFHRPELPQGRSVWVSAVLPYAYMLVLGIGLLLLTLAIAVLNAVSERTFSMLGMEQPLAGFPNLLLDLWGFAGLVLLFTSIYKVLPVVTIPLRRAVVGGFTAAMLWWLVRWVLVYYFTNVSLVNAIYGSFATVIVVLLSLEVGSIILLLGAQVIAELERSAAAGVSWYEEPAGEARQR